MMSDPGNASQAKEVPLDLVRRGNEPFFRMSGYDSLRPFFMNIVSSSNLWVFVSSNGGITAGRISPDFALFPYYTDDKITESAEITGSKTIIRIPRREETLVWEPFSVRCSKRFSISRNLYKCMYGNKVVFEEVNHSLELSFAYEWSTSPEFGIVKRSWLRNHSSRPVRVSLLDGLQNILPFGIGSDMQQSVSNLADAYKRSELHQASGLGIFALSAIIVDKAEPSEALKANVVWSTGVENAVRLLSTLQLDQFRNGHNLQEETDIKGEKAAYFIGAGLQLEPGQEKDWRIVSDVAKDHAQVIHLIRQIEAGNSAGCVVQDDVDRGTLELLRLVAGADGLQFTSDVLQDSRHYSNVLFNILRGGIFDQDYRIDRKDFLAYLKKASHVAYETGKARLDSLGDYFSREELCRLTDTFGNPNLIRLSRGYLPLRFSRRHGDPSRPWNRFSINILREDDGARVLDYEGNWRDIFQNWEALAWAYPDFVEGMVFKFLNTTTFEGYNPYRLTKDGYDWETIEPHNPWSYIGYWGDHQLIYLLKLMEIMDRVEPGAFESLWQRECFVYADVPYRIRSYEEILKDPRNTIDFDHEADRFLRREREMHGADGTLLRNLQGEVHHVNLMEKLLATLLSKVSNFIPEGGIWMNTQRPEWNDANNALVGHGVSVVTLGYMRRFVAFFEHAVARAGFGEVLLSAELHALFQAIAGALQRHLPELRGRMSDEERRAIVDELGASGSQYRQRIYSQGFSNQRAGIDRAMLAAFLETLRRYIDHSLKANKRPDGMYHTYNILNISEKAMGIAPLGIMLEGQVSAISSGCLSPEEVLSLLNAMRSSPLYRHDQNTYLLYPNKDLPGFLARNRIPEALAQGSALIQALLQAGDRSVVAPDMDGLLHFNGNFRNVSDLRVALERLKTTDLGGLAEKESELLQGIFERVFDHKSFTGRSGTFFAYEGLGSVYWHMVSKLHLAVQEACLNAAREAREEGAHAESLVGLRAQYYAIGEGIGIHKPPEVYGAFPTDPYSHTPLHKGAQQPGMTGQVKEDILTRIGELGIDIRDGRLCIDPLLLRREEFIAEAREVEMIGVGGEARMLQLEADSLCFHFAQVPVIFSLAQSGGRQIELSYYDGRKERADSCCLSREQSRKIFGRTGEIALIRVWIDPKDLVYEK